MSAIRIRRKIDSETLYLPELRSLIGKTVEIIVQEEDEEKEAERQLAQLTPSSAELRQLAKQHPPAGEWLEGEEDNPL